MTTRYTKDHEWVRTEGETATIGITAYAADQLGDVVYLELPEPGRRVNRGEAIGVVESVKAASDVYAPISGEVVEANTALADDPGRIGEDPEGTAWFLRIRPSDPGQVDGLMDADAYAEFTGA